MVDLSFLRSNKLRVVTKTCRPVRGAARSAAHGALVRQHTRAQDGLRWPPWASGASSTACAGGVCGDCTRTRGRRDDPGELASGLATPCRGISCGPLPGVNCLCWRSFVELPHPRVYGCRFGSEDLLLRHARASSRRGNNPDGSCGCGPLYGNPV
ncbi:hypothetical protein EVAR_59108_1 [Eumeta japonica]|uniref:Uncharacterized protein n=1 Tax=Eumeta variegata TaxID=151549 RepID=A0A4C1YZR7_EUMVA|nr:hypothetical protein EVAR_59108_1 [Eumeta japonica]